MTTENKTFSSEDVKAALYFQRLENDIEMEGLAVPAKIYRDMAGVRDTDLEPIKDEELAAAAAQYERGKEVLRVAFLVHTDKYPPGAWDYRFHYNNRTFTTAEIDSPPVEVDAGYTAFEQRYQMYGLKLKMGYEIH